MERAPVPSQQRCPHYGHCGSADAGACSLTYARTCEDARYFEGFLRGAAVPTTPAERWAILLNGTRPCRFYRCPGGACS